MGCTRSHIEFQISHQGYADWRPNTRSSYTIYYKIWNIHTSQQPVALLIFLSSTISSISPSTQIGSDAQPIHTNRPQLRELLLRIAETEHDAAQRGAMCLGGIREFFLFHILSARISFTARKGTWASMRTEGAVLAESEECAPPQTPPSASSRHTSHATGK